MFLLGTLIADIMVIRQNENREKYTMLTTDHANEKTAKILAKSLYRQIKSDGHDKKMVLALASNLLDLVTDEIKNPEKTNH